MLCPLVNCFGDEQSSDNVWYYEVVSNLAVDDLDEVINDNIVVPDTFHPLFWKNRKYSC
jgi:hypothetical protein